MRIPIWAALSVLVIWVGCQAPISGPTDGASDKSLVGHGTNFTPGENPFIYSSSIARNASDPAGVWAPTPEGDQLLLVTSSDLKITVPKMIEDGDGDNIKEKKNYYPMDQTYLYIMDPNASGNNKWTEILGSNGNGVVKESQITGARGADDNDDYLWAPDIDYKNAAGGGRSYKIFVPYRDKSTLKSQIAVFNRNTDPYGGFSFVDRLIITRSEASGGDANDEQAFAYDPGVFHIATSTSSIPIETDYYMAYCDAESPTGRIRIAQFTNAGLTRANDLGAIQFTNSPGNFYMEGPDLCYVQTVSQQGLTLNRVYLQFAAKVNGSQQEYIGYAHKSLAAFQSAPATGWTFDGWIQREIDPDGDVVTDPLATSEWTNHASIVPTKLSNGNDKFYYFYHYSKGDTSAATGQMRQTAMRELRFNTDGTIQGVTNTTNFALELYSGPYPFDANKTSGLSGLDVNPNASPDVMQVNYFINNNSATALGTWRSWYWIKKDSSTENDVLQGGSANVRLRHMGQDIAIIEDGSTSLGAYAAYPTGNSANYFGITTGTTYNLSNDFSKPVIPFKQNNRTPKMAETETISVYDNNGLKLGKAPKTKLTVVWPSFSGRSMASTTTLYGGDKLVRGKVASSSTSQDWYIEPVPGTDYIRIKSASNSEYLNVPSTTDGEKVVTKALNVTFNSQMWLVEPVLSGGGGLGNQMQVRIKNRWTGKYLTRGNPNNTPGDSDTDISIFSQGYNESWEAQKWFLAYD